MTTAMARLQPLELPRRYLLVAAGAVFALLAALSTDDGPVLCVFRRCTGGYCPGCGLTRSGGRLLRGDVAGSIEQHPYLILGVSQVAVLAAVWRLGSEIVRDRLRRWSRPLLYANGAAIIVVWLVRLAAGSIPVPFFG